MSCSVVFSVLLVSQRQRANKAQVGCDFIHVFRLSCDSHIYFNGEGREKNVAINISFTDIQQFFQSLQQRAKNLILKCSRKYLLLMFNVIYWVENFYFPAREKILSPDEEQRNMQKSLMHFETCRDMQMITHEILRNYCISFRISACVQPKNDKNEFSMLRRSFFFGKGKRSFWI